MPALSRHGHFWAIVMTEVRNIILREQSAHLSYRKMAGECENSKMQTNYGQLINERYISRFWC